MIARYIHTTGYVNVYFIVRSKILNRIYLIIDIIKINFYFSFTTLYKLHIRY